MPKGFCSICSYKTQLTTVHSRNPQIPDTQKPTQKPPENTSWQQQPPHALPPPIALPPSQYYICTYCSTSNCVFEDKTNPHNHNWSIPVCDVNGFQISVPFNSSLYGNWKCAHCDDEVYICA